MNEGMSSAAFTIAIIFIPTILLLWWHKRKTESKEGKV